MGIESLKLTNIPNKVVGDAKAALTKSRNTGTELQKEWWSAIREEFEAQRAAYDKHPYKPSIFS